MPRFLTSLERVAASRALPPTVGNTNSSSPAPRSCSASRSPSTARPHSGSRCVRFAFIRRAGTVHTIATRSNSPHVARRARRRQHWALEMPAASRPSIGVPDRGDGGGDLPVGQRRPVLDRRGAFRQRRRDRLAGRVVVPVARAMAHRIDGPDALPHFPGRDVFGAPDWEQRRHDVGRRQLCRRSCHRCGGTRVAHAGPPDDLGVVRWLIRTASDRRSPIGPANRPPTPRGHRGQPWHTLFATKRRLPTHDPTSSERRQTRVVDRVGRLPVRKRPRTKRAP